MVPYTDVKVLHYIGFRLPFGTQTDSVPVNLIDDHCMPHDACVGSDAVFGVHVDMSLTPDPRHVA
jgi:hypothetical protein